MLLIALLFVSLTGTTTSDFPHRGAPTLPQPVLQDTLGSDEARATVVEQLLRHGYVVVGPTAELLHAIGNIDRATSQLFAQSPTTKTRIEASMASVAPARLPELQLSCTGLRLHPAACSAAYTGPRRQHHEQFHVVLDRVAIDQMLWPGAAMPGLRTAVEGAGGVLQELSEMLLRSIAPGLYDVWSQESTKRGDPSVLDLFYYSGCKRNKSTCLPTGECDHCDAVGMSEHVDPGIFTCKYVSATQVEGLELLDRASGEWVGEARFRGNMICFVNQLLADWCLANRGPSVTATPHRVVPSGTSPRQSVVYEMRAPKVEVWQSPEQWSRAKRAEKKREAQAERQRRRRRDGSVS
jgi:isopenicillin N synthase-like dioxygenase